MADPNATTCAACGAAGELHEHHLVPRVCEGMALPTVMLCTACHGFVHDLIIPINHAELTRRGLAFAKARGVKLGNPRYSETVGLAHAANRAAADRHAANVRPIVREIQAAGATSLRDIAAALNARGVRTARGGEWHSSTVRNLLLREAAND